MAYLKLLALIALLTSIAWIAVSGPGFEQVLAVLGSISALIALFVAEGRRARQRQSVSKSSVGIQAGGDVRLEESGDRDAE